MSQILPGTRLSPAITDRLRLPLIAAPMLRVSGPELVIAACNAGVVGSFPTANANSTDELDDWLHRIKADLRPGAAPFCPNLIMRQKRFEADLDCLVRHKVELVITSVGSPEPALAPLHSVGATVLADIASERHAEKAIEVGADGLILLVAGAGGQTGWANPFAFVRAVRSKFAGPIVLAGGVSDGASLYAARVLGCDLAYMGTGFIATTESMAAQGYKDMLVTSRLDDVLLTKAFTGLETNMLRPSILAAGIDPGRLDEEISAAQARLEFGSAAEDARPRRWQDIWSAGHSVSGVGAVGPVAELVERLAGEYEAARSARL